ncbi:MAG: YdcH family protein [Rhodospirillales bacterium]|nr:YdcH family protein [Rhodospirillales bacterium]
MSKTVDLHGLEARHAALESEIETEANRPLPDQALLTELKREKLKIKEEIARASGELAA